ncbi:MAG: helix-turn-helix transcriptional regulator [Methylovirgula sp.]
MRAVKGAEDWVLKAQADALQSQIADLQAEMAEYDMLKLGQVAFAETCSLAELPHVLVQARIVRGLSQTDLAERLNMKPQQVQRYEATNYMSASLARLIEIAGRPRREDFESFEAAHDETSGAIFAWNKSERRVVESPAHQGDGEAQMARRETAAVAGRGGAELLCACSGAAIRNGTAPQEGTRGQRAE